MTPTQDITLGCYYLTAESAQARKKESQRLPLFGDRRPKSMFAHDDGAVKTHDRIRLANPDFGTQDRFTAMPSKKVIETTVGRVIFSEIWPTELGFFNKACRQEAARRPDLALLQGLRSREDRRSRSTS